MFGAVGDGRTDDTEAFAAGFAYCASRGLTLRVPAGSFVLAHGEYRLPAGGAFGLEGEGASSRIIRKAGSLDGRASVLIGVHAAAGRARSVVFRNLYIDGNRRDSQSAGLPAPPDPRAYAYEQSANIKVYCSGPGSIDEVLIADIHFYDPVADNIYIGPSALACSIGSATVRDCVFERRDHVRSDVLFGSAVRDAAVLGCRGIENGERYSRIETEYSAIGRQNVSVTVSRCVVGAVELGGATPLQSRAVLADVTTTGHCILSQTAVEATGCRLRIGRFDTGRSWVDAVVRLSGCTLSLPYDAATNTLFNLLTVRTAKALPYALEFRDTEFLIEGAGPVASDKALVKLNPARAAAGEAISASFEGCRFDRRAAISIDCVGWPELRSADNQYWSRPGGGGLRCGSNQTPSAVRSDGDRFFGGGADFVIDVTGKAAFDLHVGGDYGSASPAQLAFGHDGLADAAIVSSRRFGGERPPSGGGLAGDLYVVKPGAGGETAYIATRTSLSDAGWQAAPAGARQR